MKAFYCLWPNFKYIDKLVDAGIDTILLCAHSLPFDRGNVNPYYDSKSTIISVIKRYQSSVDLLLSPTWIRPWVKLPIDQRWVLRDGRKMQFQPCPSNELYMDERIGDSIRFASKYKMKGIIWDLEHYGHNRGIVIPYYMNFNKPKDRCYCHRCKSQKIKNIWDDHAHNINLRLVRFGSHLRAHGSYPYTGGWTIRQYPDTHLHFTEETYKKDISFWEEFKWKCNHKKYKTSPTIIPGAWAEYFSEEGYINYLKKLKKKYGHFWIYSHEKFGNKIPDPHIDYPYPELASDKFFEMLKKV